MASTYSPSLRIELIGTGDQDGVWGATYNDNLGLVEQAITKVEPLDMTSGDHTLTTANAAVDEARSAVLVLSGTPGAAATLTVPQLDKSYVVSNRTTKEITLSSGAGDTFVCPPESISRIAVHGATGDVLGVALTDVVAQALVNAGGPDLFTDTGMAPIHSPVFTGTPRAPTPGAGDADEAVATTAYVVNSTVPPGVVFLWHGSAASIPPGWVLCDGANGTPDLTDRFVLGCGSGYVEGSTGGSQDSVLVRHDHGGATDGQDARHKHGGNTSSDGTHSHGGVRVDVRWSGDDSTPRVIQGRVGESKSAGVHTHTLTVGQPDVDHTHSIQSSGVSGIGKNMPPYYVLCYMMKV